MQTCGLPNTAVNTGVYPSGIIFTPNGATIPANLSPVIPNNIFPAIINSHTFSASEQLLYCPYYYPVVVGLYPGDPWVNILHLGLIYDDKALDNAGYYPRYSYSNACSYSFIFYSTNAYTTQTDYGTALINPQLLCEVGLTPANQVSCGLISIPNTSSNSIKLIFPTSTNLSYLINNSITVQRLDIIQNQAGNKWIAFYTQPETITIY